MQVSQDLFYVLLRLLVVATIILSIKFYCKFYCKFYFTCDRSLSVRYVMSRDLPKGTRARAMTAVMYETSLPAK